METAIGVFASRDRAEEAVKDLLRQNVPEQSIVFLTRAESEAKTVGKEVGAYTGGFMGGAVGMSAGVAAATFWSPGSGLYLLWDLAPPRCLAWWAQVRERP